ncbi:MAG: hypothetical protein ACE14P_03385 [Methanotrichaceae archaeon]
MKTLILVAAMFLWAYAAAGADDNITSINICDSSSCNSIADSSLAEINLAEVDSIVEDTIGDPQMDMLAENIGSSVFPDISTAKDRNMDLSMSNNALLGTVHVNWLSGSSTANNLTIIVSLDKFIQVWGNSTQGAIAISADSLPHA